MTILVDVNLSPRWVSFLREYGFETVHWSDIGAMDAPDEEIFSWAASRNALVFTHDLDFGGILASTGMDSPSVIQVRTQDVLPDGMGEAVIRALQQFDEPLRQGAIVTVHADRLRVSMLPLRGGT